LTLLGESLLRRFEFNIVYPCNEQVSLHIRQFLLENLQHSTLEIKALALDALDIKVYAGTERVEIQGLISLALPTTERT